MPTEPGRFVLSLDLELMWGVRDRQTLATYGDAVLGARAAIPEILTRFAWHGIRASWATVGFLFARNRAEIMDHLPKRRPTYRDPRLDPYPFVFHGLGRDEQADPHHFGHSLVTRIAETEGQELASHTFSHLTCLEPGATLAAFEDDLASAQAIAGAHGHRLRSLVFPRNQMSELHIAAATRQGFGAVRVPPGAWLYRTRPRSGETRALRALRLADGVVPLARTLGRVTTPGRVPASRFLRPVSRLPGFDAAHLARIETEMTRAARLGRLYHLWWHPHNFGRATEANLAQLDRILATFAGLRDTHGMVSATMAEAAALPPVSAKFPVLKAKTQ